MLSIIVEEFSKVSKYPYIGSLKSDRRLLVFFVSDSSGFVFRPNDSHKLGDWFSSWVEKDFEIVGKLTIEYV